MNMPPISRDVLRPASMPCFCGQVCPPESYYCSLDCAREDAFNALTLGKPHESSNPSMPPLPTLPKDFFKLPPKRSLDDADELLFMTSDHGPFQQRAKDRTKSVPKSVTTSIASTASKWTSHYQHTQQRESSDASLDIPFFLVDEKSLGISAAAPGTDNSTLPTPIPEPRLARPVSLDIFSPAYPCIEGNTLTPYDYTADISYQRSSSSSYNSLLTSGTSSRSRSSFTSATGPSEPSPTSSEYSASLSQSQPRLGYGSAFSGGHEDKPLTIDIVRIAENVRDSILLAKRSSRKRSSTDATLTVVRQDLPRKELPLHKGDPISRPSNDVHSSVPRPSQPTPPPRKANTSVPRSQWPQFGIFTSRSEQRITTVVAPVPMQLHTTNTSSSRPVLGTVVKKTTIATKGRLPIGTPQVPQRPMTPSITLPAGINLSLHSKSFCAPAYAMSAPKIPSSTRPLHTSPSMRSLKGQKEQVRVQIPSMEPEHHKPVEEAFKPSFELKSSTEAENSKELDTPVVNDDNLTSSTPTGSPFKLSAAPKPHRSLNFTLNVNSVMISTSTPQLIRRASPPCAQDRSPSTAGGPFRPQATPIGNRRRGAPIDKSAKSDFFMPMTIEA